jgi:hypothetical protein
VPTTSDSSVSTIVRAQPRNENVVLAQVVNGTIAGAVTDQGGVVILNWLNKSLGPVHK